MKSSPTNDSHLSAGGGAGGADAAETIGEVNLSAICDSFEIPVVVLDAAQKGRFANAAARELFGIQDAPFFLSELNWTAARDAETVAGSTPWPWALVAQGDCRKSGRVLGWQSPTGDEVFLSAKAQRMAGPQPAETQIVVSFSDVSEQVRTEDSLRVSAQRLAESQSIGQLGGWELNLETNELFWTAETYRLYDTTPAEFDPDVATVFGLYLPESRQTLSAAREQALATGEGYDLELETLTTKGRQISVRTTGRVALSDGRPVKLSGVVQDITAAKKAEAALRASEQFARNTLDALPESICVLDAAGTIVAVNRTWREFAPDSAHPSVGVGASYLTVCENAEGEDRATADGLAAGIRSVLQGEIETYRDEYSCPTDEHQRWFSVRVTRFLHGNNQRVVVTHSDITARWTAQLQLEQNQVQLRHLAQRLQMAKEEESRRIAGVVHDELGQELTGLKMDLRAIEKLLIKADDDAVQKALKRTLEATELVNATVRTVQRIASELRPAILDQLGLWAALREEVRIFERRANLACQLALPENESMIPGACATACFRILQEALTNVARHAQADQVDISLALHDSRLVMLINDNGCGIDLTKLSDPQSMGLFGMRERARQLGGALSLSRRPEGGTSVRAEFRLDAPILTQEAW